MRVIGTAGHVDHGKSTLIAALTGKTEDKELVADIAALLLDLARVQEGEGPVDAKKFARLVTGLLAGSLGGG